MEIINALRNNWDTINGDDEVRMNNFEINPTHHIHNDEIAKKLDNIFKSHQACVIYGPPQTGKSVIARMYGEKLVSAGELVAWISVESEDNILNNYRKYADWAHNHSDSSLSTRTIFDLLQKTTSKHSKTSTRDATYIILDNVTNFDDIIFLVNCHIESGTKILATTQIHEYEIETELFECLEIKFPSYTNCIDYFHTFPSKFHALTLDKSSEICEIVGNNPCELATTAERIFNDKSILATETDSRLFIHILRYGKTENLDAFVVWNEITSPDNPFNMIIVLLLSLNPDCVMLDVVREALFPLPEDEFCPLLPNAKLTIKNFDNYIKKLESIALLSTQTDNNVISIDSKIQKSILFLRNETTQPACDSLRINYTQLLNTLLQHEITENRPNLATLIIKCVDFTGAHEKMYQSMGFCFDTGFGVTINLQWAAKFYKQSAICGNPVSQYRLGLFYHHGTGVEADIDKAVKFYTCAAQQGNINAKVSLGECLLNGTGGETHYEKAVELLLEGVDAGNAVAQRCIGDCYFYGYGYPVNYTEALNWYMKAADQGNVKAMHDVANIYRKGYDVGIDFKEALKWYKDAANRGFCASQIMMGYFYHHGRCGVTIDYHEAMKWYLKAAEQEDADAEFNIGKFFENGYGVMKNYREAMNWYRKSAHRGNPFGQFAFGKCFECGFGVVPDYSQAVEWFQKSAEAGNSYGQYSTGYCYEHGYGVKKDLNEAMKWYTKAANQGNADGQSKLGLFFEKGYGGVASDYVEATEWYSKAAEQGQADAKKFFDSVKLNTNAANKGDFFEQYYLGRRYENGYGVDKSFKEALEWYRKAADQGYANAQYIVGHCYEHGHEVTKDYSEAVTWYKKAAEQGYANAQYALGLCFQKGNGVEKDSVQAVNLLIKAAKQGVENAEYHHGILFLVINQFNIYDSLVDDELQSVSGDPLAAGDSRSDDEDQDANED
ncbi:hypothetical protein HK098_008308 [Nowakowskiella sp. JEL0407]|nr:hypothetical protein HK098_008308 [Nowakowskiella sp. JEL0407]